MAQKLLRFDGGLNLDNNGVSMPEGDYSDALSTILFPNKNGEGYSIKKIESHAEVLNRAELDPDSYISTTNVVTMTVDDSQNIYAVLYDGALVKISGIFDGTPTVTTLIRRYNVGAVPDDLNPYIHVIDDVIIWNWHQNGTPLMWKADRAMVTDPDIEVLELIRQAPIYAPQVTEIWSSSVSNVLSDKQYQFASRYVYDTGDVSVLSPFSQLYSGIDGIKSFYVAPNSSEPSVSYVSKVEFYVREGNDGSWKRFKTINYGSTPASEESVGTRGDEAAAWAISGSYLNFKARSNKSFIARATSTGTETDTATRSAVTLTSPTQYRLSAKTGYLPDVTPTDYVYRVEVRNGASALSASLEFKDYESNTYKETIVTLPADSYDLIVLWDNQEVNDVFELDNVTLEPINTFGFTGSTYETLPSDEASASFDFVPFNTKNIEVIDGKIFLANNEEEYTGDYNSISLTVTPNSETFGSTTADEGSYRANVAVGSDPHADYSIPSSKTFANKSRYGFGVIFLDKYLRTRGVEASVTWETPEFDVAVADLVISEDGTIPSWAEYWQVVTTHNLDKDFIYEGFASGVYFLAEVIAPNDSVFQKSISTVRSTRRRGESKFSDAGDAALKIGTDTVFGAGGFLEQARGPRTERSSSNPSSRGGKSRTSDGSGRGFEIELSQLASVEKRAEGQAETVRVPELPLKPFTPHTVKGEDGASSNVTKDAVSKIKFFVVDIEGMFQADRPYNFQEGDRITGNFMTVNSQFAEYPIVTMDILAQEGSLLYCDPTPMLELGTNDFVGYSDNSNQSSLFFEIYSPRQSNTNVYYAVGNVQPIADLSGGHTEVVRGDCYWNDVELKLPASQSYEPAFAEMGAAAETGTVGNDATPSLLLQYKDFDLTSVSDYTNNKDFDLSDNKISIKNGTGARVRLRATATLANNYGNLTPGAIGDTLFRVYVVETNTNKELTQAVYNVADESGAVEVSLTSTIPVSAGDQLAVRVEFRQLVAGGAASETLSVDLDFIQIGIIENTVSDFGFALSRTGLDASTSGSFLLKGISRSGDVQTSWNKDHGKPYIDVPYLNTDRLDKRVRWGGNKLVNSSASRLLSFKWDDRIDLASDVGPINGLVKTSANEFDGGVLLAMGSTNIASLYIGQTSVRFGGQTQLVGSDDVIGGVNILKGGWGLSANSGNGFARDKDGRVYWFDAINNAFLRYTNEGIERMDENIRTMVGISSGAESFAFYDPYYDIVFINYFTGGPMIMFKNGRPIGKVDYGMMYQGASCYTGNQYFISTTNNNLYRSLGSGYNSFLGSAQDTPYIELAAEFPHPVHAKAIALKTDAYRDYTQGNNVATGSFTITITNERGQSTTLTNLNFIYEDGELYADILRDENSGGTDPIINGLEMIGTSFRFKIELNDDTIQDDIQLAGLYYEPSSGHFGT